MKQRTLKSDWTSVGNVGTGEDTLQTFTMIGKTLFTNDDFIRIETEFEVSGNANQKRVKLYFGSAAIFDTQPTGLPVSTAFSIHVEVIVGRVSSGNQKYSVRYTAAGLLGHFYGTTTETDTADIVIKTTGETNAASNDDVVCPYLVVEGGAYA